MNPLATLATITAVLGLAGASARTWTSADGKRTFDGELQSYDPAAGIVTVVLGGGQEIQFTLDKLSAADRAFLSKQAAPGIPAGNLHVSLEKEGVLRILRNGKFVAHKIEPRPLYFLLYFSASW